MIKYDNLGMIFHNRNKHWCNINWVKFINVCMIVKKKERKTERKNVYRQRYKDFVVLIYA